MLTDAVVGEIDGPLVAVLVLNLGLDTGVEHRLLAAQHLSVQLHGVVV